MLFQNLDGHLYRPEQSEEEENEYENEWNFRRTA